MSLVNLGHSGALDISVKHDKYLGEAYRSCVAYSLIQGRSIPWPIRNWGVPACVNFGLFFLVLAPESRSKLGTGKGKKPLKWLWYSPFRDFMLFPVPALARLSGSSPAFD